MFNQRIEEFAVPVPSSNNGTSSSLEAGRVQLQSGGHDNQLQHQHNQESKSYRNAKKIDGPVIPTEYSDPDLQRQSSKFSAMLQQATSNVSSKRQESTFVMDISPSVVGWIIGRSGIRIKEIQSYSGCKMWVDQDVPNDQPRKIYFHGNKQNIDAAVRRVNELVQTAPILSSDHVVSGKGLTSVIVDCPVSLVGLLIGKRGWTIKKIQQASNAQISINQSVREGLPRKIIVSGDEQSVSIALKLITEAIRDKTLLGANGGGDLDGGDRLTMRTVSDNGHVPHDMPSVYDQEGQGQHKYSHIVDRYISQQSQGHPYPSSHNYQSQGVWGNKHMQGQAKRGGYGSNTHYHHPNYQQQAHYEHYGGFHQKSASRSFLSQHGRIQESQHVRNGHNAPHGVHRQYGEEHLYQHQKATSGAESYNNTGKAAGGSSIFDFQHQHQLHGHSPVNRHKHDEGDDVFPN